MEGDSRDGAIEHSTPFLDRSVLGLIPTGRRVDHRRTGRFRERRVIQRVLATENLNDERKP